MGRNRIQKNGCVPAGKVIGCDRRTVLRMAKAGTFPKEVCWFVGREPRFDIEKLKLWKDGKLNPEEAAV